MFLVLIVWKNFTSDSNLSRILEYFSTESIGAGIFPAAIYKYSFITARDKNAGSYVLIGEITP